MNVLILVCTVIWSFGGGYQNTPSYQFVGSPEQAATIIWNSSRSNLPTVEPDRKRWNLYRINLENKKVEEVKIPVVHFD